MVSELLEQRFVQAQLFLPSGFVDVGDGVELLGCEVKAAPAQLFIAGADTKHVFLAVGTALDAVDHPL
jgi:hypothetical protein